MNKQRSILAVVACSVLIFACMAIGNGQTPIGPEWWPSEWGADDQRGAANRLTPEKVIEAAQLIKTGKVYHVGQVYEQGHAVGRRTTFQVDDPGSAEFRSEREEPNSRQR